MFRSLAGAAAAAVLVTAAPAATANPVVTGFDVPTADAVPHSVAVADDGTIWFTERLAGKIGRLDANGIEEFTLPDTTWGPTAIALGPDGSVWFTGQDGNVIGRRDPAGGFVEYLLPADGSSPAGIAALPDGTAWFTERTGHQVGYIDGFGDVNEIPLGGSVGPLGITVGPDGAIWYTENVANRVGRVDPATEVVTRFPLPAGSRPHGITTGPDGALWITLRGTNQVARMTVAGALSYRNIPTPVAGAAAIVAGDDEVWFTEATTNKVARVPVDGGPIEEYDAEVNAAPQGIALAGETPWFSEPGLNRVARLDLEVTPPPDEAGPAIDIWSPDLGDWTVTGTSTLDAGFDCTDEAGGSGLASCLGDVESGDPVGDAALGLNTLHVTASDIAGNTSSASADYLVFASADGTLLTDPTPRPGAWLTLQLGMGLDQHGPDPLATATTQQVSCADSSVIGGEEIATVRPRVTHLGELDLRWDTDRAWSNQCRTLTLTFSAEGWSGAPAVFGPVSYGLPAGKR